MRNVVVGMCALLAIPGCTLGIKDDASNAIHDSFHVGISYQEAYRRADAFAHQCHTSANALRGSFNVSGNLYTDSRAGEVRINLPSYGKDLETIRVVAAANGGADVTVSAWGRGMWDAGELAAVRSSIESGQPTCRH